MQELYQGLGSKALPSAAIAESRRPSLIGTKISRRIASAKRRKAAGACEVGSGDWTHLILRSRSQLPTSASLCSQWQTPVPTRNVSEGLYNMLPSAHSQLSARSIYSLGHRFRSRSASPTFAFWTVAGLLSFVSTCIAALCTGFFHIAGWRRSSEPSSPLASSDCQQIDVPYYLWNSVGKFAGRLHLGRQKAPSQGPIYLVVADSRRIEIPLVTKSRSFRAPW